MPQNLARLGGRPRSTCKQRVLGGRSGSRPEHGEQTAARLSASLAASRLRPPAAATDAQSLVVSAYVACPFHPPLCAFSHRSCQTGFPAENT